MAFPVLAQDAAQTRAAAISSAANARELGAATMGEPLLGAKDVSSGDLQSLKTAMTAFAARTKGDDFTAIEDYLAANPNSPWRVQILHSLARQYYVVGRFSKSLATWEKAWEEGKKATDPELKNIVDDIFGELARMHGRIGNFERLEELQEESEGRKLAGPGQNKAQGAWGGLWLMKNQPATSFRCGPSALGRIMSLREGKQGIDPRVQDFKSTQKGTSLAQIYAWSRKSGGGYQMARRTPGAAVITPCVVHWKVGHFGALTEPHGNAYIVKDGTFLDDFVISKEALDDESSGYFLVPEGNLPEGWTVATEEEAAGIWGKGPATDLAPGCGTTICCTNGGKGCGMAEYAFHKMDASLVLYDIPVWYEPGYGPEIEFRVAYYQNDTHQPASSPYANFGSKWTHSYLGFVEYNPDTAGWPASAIVYERDGGFRQYTFQSYTAGTTPPYYFTKESDPNPRDGSILKYIPVSPNSTYSLGTFERIFPDGSKIVYGYTDGAIGSESRSYLTAEVDREGPQIQLGLSTVSGVIRLNTITDAAGKVTTLSYDNGSFPSRITKVTDPFSRHADFGYDGQGRLTSITDMGGIVSQFEYEDDEVIALITPYGKTRFDFGMGFSLETGISQWTEATDPAGAKERMEFRSITPTSIIPASDSVASDFDALQYEIGTFDNYSLQHRNSFYWNKKTMAEYPGDYTKAEIFHWLHVSGSSSATDVLASTKKPLESRVYYAYAGQPDYFQEGSTAWPIVMARKIKNESGSEITQIYRYEYDSVGNVTKITDPVGRITKYQYDTAKQNRIKVIQVNSGGDEVLWEATSFAGPGMPTTIKDAARQTTTLTWNSTFKKVATITNPKSEVVTYTYETNPANNGYGKLKTVTGDAPNVTVTNTYDAYGRLASVTDGDGYTLSYQYDNLDRLTQTTYPDSTTEQTIYGRLDPEWTKDRLGRWTHYFYDSARRVAATVDPANRVTKYDWCSCGALHGLIDANGNHTKFKQDIQFRTIEKEYADGKKTLFEYEAEISRLKKKTDAKAQVTNYKYFKDNNLQQVSYTNTSGGALTPPTSSVSFTYDPYYNRIATMVDGTGTTNYSYYAWSSGGQSGATQLQTVNGPMDSGTTDAITYAYDQLGRLSSRTINGSAESYAYDAKGRTTQIVNPLDTFGYGYDGTSERLASTTYPSGSKLSSSFTYLNNAGDHRLDEITHSLTGNGTLAKFKNSYDAVGNITQWKQQIGVGATMARWELKYDAVDQLTIGNKKNDSTNALLEQNGNRYDKLGNRLTKQVDAALTTGTFNNLNQLTTLTAGGTGILTLEGTVSEPATVTVGGNPAPVDSSNIYRGEAGVIAGTNNIPIIATDANANSRTNTARVVVPAATTRSFTYDANGNLTGDGERNYEWDAQDRMIAITYVGNTKRSEFTYDGFNRCVRIVEKTGGTPTSQKWYLWDYLTRVEERDNNGTTVLKQYFDQGFKAGSAKYYYAKDHLGSIWGLVDETGVVRGLWPYNLWGKRDANQIIFNPIESDFTFTGHFQHEESDLVLAPFRTYDPVTARWLSRDPLEEAEMLQGPNLYTYVFNSPVVQTDPTGELVPLVIPIAIGAAAVIAAGAYFASPPGITMCKNFGSALADDFNRGLDDLISPTMQGGKGERGKQRKNPNPDKLKNKDHQTGKKLPPKPGNKPLKDPPPKDPLPEKPKPQPYTPNAAPHHKTPDPYTGPPKDACPAPIRGK